MTSKFIKPLRQAFNLYIKEHGEAYSVEGFLAAVTQEIRNTHPGLETPCSCVVKAGERFRNIHCSASHNIIAVGYINGSGQLIRCT